MRKFKTKQAKRSALADVSCKTSEAFGVADVSLKSQAVKKEKKMNKFSKFGGKNAVCKSKFNKFALGALIVSSLVSVSCANWYDGVFVGVEGKYNLKSDFSTTLMEDFGGSIYYPNIKLDDNP